jgi:hypothetical protein
MATNKKVDEEVQFLIEAHNAAKSDSEFKKRLQHLYLMGDVSEKAYEAIALIYGYSKPNRATITHITNILGGSSAESGGCGSAGGGGGRC